NRHPVAGLPCQWRRIIGSSSGLTSANLKFLFNRSIFKPPAYFMNQLSLFTHKKRAKRPVFI
ncbi:hypothetical protein SC127_04755, partial [Pantoea sp. T14]|uniref:hypothetical protein n=1 Tax=Pantoea sp. T14 TaxID=3085685 RepID=UPI002FC978D4